MLGLIGKLLLLGMLVEVMAQERYYDEIGTSESQSDETPKIVLSLIICIVGLFGNLVAIFVILVLKEYQKSVTHWYVLQLAIADSLFLLTLPFKVSEDLNKYWIYPEWMCKAKETVLFLNYYASILFLMIMSVDRYIAVCHTFTNFLQKLRKRSNAFIIAVAVWSVSLLLCIPVMLYSFKIGSKPVCHCSYEFPDKSQPRNFCEEEGFDGAELEECLKVSSPMYAGFSGERYCRKLVVPGNISDYFSGSSSGSGSGSGDEGFSGDGSNSTGGNEIQPACHYWDKPDGWFAFLGFNFAVMFIVPLIVMVICYGLILKRLSTSMIKTATPSTSSFSNANTGSVSQKSRKKSSSKSSNDRRRVTIMCAALVGCFVVCWLPFHTVHLLKISGIPGATETACKTASIVGSLLAYLNSALNPYLYSLLGTNFSRRWNSARNTLRRTVRRTSSSSGVGSVRVAHKKSTREGGASYTTTALTKLFRSRNSKSHSAQETHQSMDSTGQRSESQHLCNLHSVHGRSLIGEDSPPPTYERSMALDSKETA